MTIKDHCAGCSIAISALSSWRGLLSVRPGWTPKPVQLEELRDCKTKPMHKHAEEHRQPQKHNFFFVVLLSESVSIVTDTHFHLDGMDYGSSGFSLPSADISRRVPSCMPTWNRTIQLISFLAKQRGLGIGNILCLFVFLDQAHLKIRDPPVSSSQVLGL